MKTNCHVASVHAPLYSRYFQALEQLSDEWLLGITCCSSVSHYRDSSSCSNAAFLASVNIYLEQLCYGSTSEIPRHSFVGPLNCGNVLAHVGFCLWSQRFILTWGKIANAMPTLLKCIWQLRLMEPRNFGSSNLETKRRDFLMSICVIAISYNLIGYMMVIQTKT